MTYVKHFKPDVEVVGESWPKLFQPDYTEIFTKILQTKPQVLYTCLWGGDITAFIDQGNIYALFGQTETFAVNMADYTALTAVKNLPKGIHSGNRYIKTFPNTPENAAWADAYRAKYNEYPTNWSWENASAMQFLAAAAKKANSADGAKLAEALHGTDDQLPVRRRRHAHLARRGSHSRRLRHRLGHHPAEGALCHRHDCRATGSRSSSSKPNGRSEGLHVSDAAGMIGRRRDRAGNLSAIADHRLPVGHGSCCARDLPLLSGLRGHADDRRPDHRHAAVPGRRRADPDLRRAEGHQFHPRLLLHAGRLFRADHLPAHRQLHADRAGAGARRRRSSALVFERLFISRVYGQNVLMQLLVCYGFVLIFDDVVKIVWGPEFKSMGMPPAFQVPPLFIAGGVVPPFYLFLIGVGVRDRRWRCGWSSTRRGSARPSARPRINPQHGRRARHQYRAVCTAWCSRSAGCWPGFAGALAAPVRSLTPGMGFSILIESLHRHRHRRHGLDRRRLRRRARDRPHSRSFGSLGFPLFTDGLMYLFMVLILIARPTGLFGKEIA